MSSLFSDSYKEDSHLRHEIIYYRPPYINIPKGHSNNSNNSKYTEKNNTIPCDWIDYIDLDNHLMEFFIFEIEI